MKIVVERFFGDVVSTLGTLWLDGQFFCFTLEDAYHPVKIQGKTRIPAGHYDVRLRTEGGMSPKYAERFPDIHQGMLWLQDVPEFDWVYLHIGNRAVHTEGCLLVAYTADRLQGFIGNSTEAYQDLYRRVAPAAAAGDLRIHIEDRDRAPDPRQMNLI